MRNSVSIFFSAILVSSNVMAGSTGAIVFPGPEDVLNKNKCVVVQRACTFDEGQVCKIKYCGVQIKQSVLDDFVRNHQLIGKRFQSIFDLQTYIKKNLPPELSDMTVAFSYKKSDLKNYNPNRINVLLDSKDYINKIVIE